MSKVDALTQLLDFFKKNTSGIIADYIQVASSGNLDSNPKSAAMQLIALTKTLFEVEAKMLELDLVTPNDGPDSVEKITKHCFEQLQEVPWKTTTRAATSPQNPDTIATWADTERALSRFQDFFTSLEVILKLLN